MPVLKVNQYYLFFIALWIVLALPQTIYAQAMCTGTGAVCTGCEQPGNDDRQAATLKLRMREGFQKAYQDIVGALNDMQASVTDAFLTAGIVDGQIAAAKLQNTNANATYTIQQQNNLASNIKQLEYKQAATPTVDECVETNTANQSIQGVVAQTAFNQAQGLKNLATQNAFVTANNIRKQDYLAPKISTESLSELSSIIGFAAPPPMRTASGQCLANGATYAAIGAKYGFTKVSDVTDIDSHATHTGGAVDFRYSDAKIQAAINNPNSAEAQELRTALNAMAAAGANLIQFENAATKSTWKWNGSAFVNTHNSLPANFTGSHIHVGNNNFSSQAQTLVNNPNATLPLSYSCAQLEQWTGKSIEQLQAAAIADIAEAVEHDCKRYPMTNTCLGSYSSMQCKCNRARVNLLAMGSRYNVLVANMTKATENSAYNSPSTAGDDNKSAMNILYKTETVTGVNGFTIGDKNGAEQINLMLAALMNEWVNPDEKLNKDAVEKTAAGRMQLFNFVQRTMKANIQAAIVTQMASYQMPVMQGGKEAIEMMVANILSDNPTDNEKKSLLAMANQMIGPGDTISLSAQSNLDVMRFTSYNYQQNAAMNPSKNSLQFLFVLTKQVREKMRQLHMLQMINLMKSIELAQSAGA